MMRPFYRNKWFSVSLKVAFLGVLIYFISSKFDSFTAINLNFISNLSRSALLLLLTAFCLVGLNWGFESIKWYLLVNTVEKMSFSKAFTAVLSGVSTGMVTPNRLGNFIGRVAFMKSDNRFQGTLLTFVGNIAQFTVTIACGLLALIGLYSFQNELAMTWIYVLGFFGLTLGLLLYFNLGILNNRIFLNYLPLKTRDVLANVDDISMRMKVEILFFSLMRYVVFTVQYVLIVYAFKTDISVMELFLHINVVYLVMTLIPALFFGKLFVREAAAVLVLGWMGVHLAIILTSGFILWLFNLALPALLGGFLILKRK